MHVELVGKQNGVVALFTYFLLGELASSEHCDAAKNR
jgi:hypothetical protein